VEVTFSPTAIGPRSANVQVASSAPGSPQTVSLFGTGQAATETFYASNSSLTFPSTNVATTSGAVADTIYNEGTSAITITNIAIIGANSGDFTLSLNNCPSSLTPGAGCTIEATFRPSAIGLRTAQIQITDSAPGSPHVINLSGTGRSVTDALELEDTTLAFGTQNIGVPSGPHAFAIYDYGTGNLSLTSFTVGGANAGDFSVSFNNCGSSLTPGGGCTVEVIFTPSAVGDRTATLSIASSDPNSPAVVALTGTGLPATQTVTFVYSSYTFPPTNLSTTSANMSITLFNFGTAPVSLTNFSIAGANASEFSIATNNCPGTLNSGAGCTVTVNFTPGAVGARSASLQVTDSAPGSPQTASLFGTGQTPTQVLSLEYSSLTFAAQTVGTSSSGQYTYLYNQGTSTITLTGFTFGGPNAGDFSISQNQCGATITSGSNCYVYVIFTPSAVGQRIGNLSIASSAPGSPAILSLFGTGQ
jgi:hypothetical protein